MLAEDEDAVVCDMAETYHVYNIWELPADTLAVLASGLGNDSRIKTKLRGGAEGVTDRMMLAMIADLIAALIYGLAGSKDKREHIIDKLYPAMAKSAGYSTGEDFLKARAEIIKKVEENG